MIVFMDILLSSLILAVFGLIFGSFAGASVWRLRARQLSQEKSDGELVDEKEYERLKPLLKRSKEKQRSQCLDCKHKLAWYDLVPLVSWLSLAGKCRYCKKSIGWFELTIEFVTATLFVASFFLWPYGFESAASIAMFILWLAGLVCLVVLFAYDAFWMVLPLNIMVIFALLGIGFAALHLSQTGFTTYNLLSLLGALLILPGIYLLLGVVSRWQWVGNGDYKLAIGLAFYLTTWQASFAALFFANLIGCFLVIPGMITGKLSRKSTVPFGPLLILGFLCAFFWANIFMKFLGF